jgi:hypothetical protein
MVLLPSRIRPSRSARTGFCRCHRPRKCSGSAALIHQPDRFARGTSAVRRQVLAVEHARQDRALVRRRRPRTAFRGRRPSAGKVRSPAAQGFDMRLGTPTTQRSLSSRAG